MATLTGFGAFAAIHEEKITENITRRVLAGEKAMMVWWSIKAGVHAATHSHPSSEREGGRELLGELSDRIERVGHVAHGFGSGIESTNSHATACVLWS
jgi:hypothetical protein